MRVLACCLVLILVSAVTGCAKDPNAGLSSREVKERYARLLIDGFSHEMYVVKAERADPATLELFNIRLDDGTHYLHADRAEILVSTELGAVSLRLYGVVTADPDTGELHEIKGFTTEPTRIASLIP